MARYPISHNGGKTLGDYFEEIMTFHIPPSKNTQILDSTCGKRHLWVNFFQPNLGGFSKIEEYKEVIFSDVIDYGYNFVANIKNLSFENKFNGIIYDSPYFFGYKNSNDPRKGDYGDYIQNYENLLWYMDINEKFPKWLQSNGKLIVKCADQYHTQENKFYAHHYTWIERFTNFEIMDIYIFIHHRMSPTAFQVKERQCSVIMHTYFLIFKLKKEDS